MERVSRHSRRRFLTRAAAGMSLLGAGPLLMRSLLADPTQLATRIDEAPSEHPLIPALKMASESLAALAKVNDYKGTFTKHELVGRKVIDTRMEFKLREEPFSVYLKFLHPHAGREVIYVHGHNNNYLQVHDVGFASLAGTLSLDPTGSYAMEENRHPVSSMGLRNMVQKLIETWLDDTKLDGITVNTFPNAHLGQIPCKVVETSHRRKQPGAKFQMTRLYTHSELGHPLRLQAYDFPGKAGGEAPLVEDYHYGDLAMNVGLTDMDFSTKNPKYRF
jgi:hypothetical protein